MMQTKSALRIVIDGRVEEGAWGGVEQVVRGLAYGLGTLDQSTERYILVVANDAQAHSLAPFANERLQIEVAADWSQTPPLKRALRRATYTALRYAKPLRRKVLGRAWAALAPTRPQVAHYADVVHFATQMAFPCSRPFVYQPHDLQHLHLPQLFSDWVFDWREASYRASCRAASVIVAMTQWGKQDLIKHYELPPHKIAVVPWASSLTTYPQPSPEDRSRIAVRYNLPSRFALYPAVTWPHKNHLRLLRVLRKLRDEGLAIPLVMTGGTNDYTPVVDEQVTRLGLSDQVIHLGFVPGKDLAALYDLARALVYPSLFEGWGLPVVEAFERGLPVTCSNVASLPEVAGGAALLFDPYSEREMEHAIRTIWLDEQLRRKLVAKGRQRAALLSWGRTARILRSIYRVLGAAQLSEEDRELLRDCWPGFDQVRPAART